MQSPRWTPSLGGSDQGAFPSQPRAPTHCLRLRSDAEPPARVPGCVPFFSVSRELALPLRTAQASGNMEMDSHSPPLLHVGTGPGKGVGAEAPSFSEPAAGGQGFRCWASSHLSLPFPLCP